MATNLRLILVAAPWLAAGCGAPPHRAEFTSGYPVYDCPAHLERQVILQAEVRPIELQMASLQQTAIETRGAVSRRLHTSITPSGLHPKDRIVWSALNVSTYGGTLLSWDRYELAAPRKGGDETSSVTLSPGQLKVMRMAKGSTDLAGSHAIDLVVMPGGVAVDDTIIRFAALWERNGKPLESDRVSLDFMPVRHPPGLDVVEAELELTYVVRVGDTGDEWVCSTQTRLTLVDRDSLRQPLWDLGLASANAARKGRLALFDPALGAVRLVFDSPASAHSFSSWLRATRSTKVGSLPLAVFEQSGPWAQRPFGPISEDAMRTLRPIQDQDIDAIAVGPAGES